MEKNPGRQRRIEILEKIETARNGNERGRYRRIRDERPNGRCSVINSDRRGSGRLGDRLKELPETRPKIENAGDGNKRGRYGRIIE